MKVHNDKCELLLSFFTPSPSMKHLPYVQTTFDKLAPRFIKLNDIVVPDGSIVDVSQDLNDESTFYLQTSDGRLFKNDLYSLEALKNKFLNGLAIEQGDLDKDSLETKLLYKDLSGAKGSTQTIFTVLGSNMLRLSLIKNILAFSVDSLFVNHSQELQNTVLAYLKPELYAPGGGTQSQQ